MSSLYFFLILVSTCGMAFLVVLKILEIKTGKVEILRSVSASTDPLIREKIEAGKAVFMHFNRSNFEKGFRIIVVVLFHVFGTAGLFVSKYYKKFMSRVRGKKLLKTGGIVSFFLKNVTESKREEGKKL